MPHIGIKMLKGRTQEQKEKLAAALVRTLTKELGCSEHYVTCTIEDFDAVQWQKVFEEEVTKKQDKVFKKAEYDPKDLL
ncbi:MAG TPA: tautomerase family protein [Candidatus Borkfalkia faecipullorum]|uniref:Tautomerase family protein n=1 Tax=Candidatus Borkfalkia faecipullorum TaxID=2838510 RepID=A0A9D1V7H1_9FIRM|nr:tautomerase family protein [Candidatus Borkfalkia faecipullorum]